MLRGMPEDASTEARLQRIAEEVAAIKEALGRLVAAWERWEPLLEKATAGPAHAWAAMRRVRQHGN